MLAQLVPAPLVRVFAGPYVAGDSMQHALDTAARLWTERGVLSTLDLLGEDVREDEQVDKNLEVYISLIEAIGRDERWRDAASRPSVSLKPSAFTTEDPQQAFPRIRRIADAAQRAGVAMTIDMEDHRWTDVTIEASVELFKLGYDVGTVLQTRLNRTREDLDKIPSGMRIRLVIGIYPEHEGIATTDKPEMKQRLLDFARLLVERQVFVEFATHDEVYVERFVRDIAPQAIGRSEVQMLLGVPRAKLEHQLREASFGLSMPVRLYVPFAIGWDDATAYLRRRMDESPNMIWLVLRNLFNHGR